MPRQTQLTFKSAPSFEKHFRTEHGGDLYAGKRKEARPLSAKQYVHVVLRSSRAKGSWSLLHPDHRKKVRRLVDRTAVRFEVHLDRFANSGNHLHLLVKAKTKEGLQSFLRTLPALTARLITGARKGQPKGKFWDGLAYTRLVGWGCELMGVRRYLWRNELEAVGFLGKDDRAVSFVEALARRGLHLQRPAIETCSLPFR